MREYSKVPQLTSGRSSVSAVWGIYKHASIETAVRGSCRRMEEARGREKGAGVDSRDSGRDVVSTVVLGRV